MNDELWFTVVSKKASKGMLISASVCLPAASGAQGNYIHKGEENENQGSQVSCICSNLRACGNGHWHLADHVQTEKLREDYGGYRFH